MNENNSNKNNSNNIQPDFTKCFAYEKHKTPSGRVACKILTEELCKLNGKCSFFKTQEQFNADKRIADELYKKKHNDYIDDLIFG